MNKSQEHISEIASRACERPATVRWPSSPKPEIAAHFMSDLEELKMDEYYGQDLAIVGNVYDHHGIGIGNGRVIHHPGAGSFASSSGKGGKCIRRDTLEDFANGEEITVKPHPDRRYSPAEAVERAESKLGECEYSILSHNCEHFVNWCIDGEEKSEQADAGVKVAVGVAAVALVAGIFFMDW